MRVKLDIAANSLLVQQNIVYYNQSQDTLSCLYLHDWNNAFSNKNSALGKRFIENYRKTFFFAKDKDRGHTKINNIAVNFKTTNWERPNGVFDYIKIEFDKPLIPNVSVKIDLNYILKIPNAKFTSYGFKNSTYNLRYWHLVPVVYDHKWQLMHHLDMDDLQQAPTDYQVTLEVPKSYTVSSNLEINRKEDNTYFLYGINRQDLQLNLSIDSNYHSFTTDEIVVSTNLNNIEISKEVKKDFINRQLLFLKKHLGNYPHKKLYINKTAYEKNPLYGMNQLPNFLRPFSDAFEWDIRMFKILTQEYINNSMLLDNRDNTWLKNGMHTYMLMQYVKTYYPDTKLIGSLSKIWGIRTYHAADLKFNDRYKITYQHIASRNHDQALCTPADSLTNFNRLITHRYKASLALQYLDNYIGDSIVSIALKEYFAKNRLKKSKKTFKQCIEHYSKKDTDWFFKDFLQTNKKIDYSLKKESKTKDSITLTIKNRRNISVPISLYSINKGQIRFIDWYTQIDSKKSIRLSTKDTDSWLLNYQGIVPEIKQKNNKETKNWKLFKRPLKIKWLKDISDPKYTQIFIEPRTDYNLYDGLILATTLKNESSLHKNFEYVISPAYSLRSRSLSGSAKIIYHRYLESQTLNSFRIGLTGSYFHYQPQLAYRKLTPFIQFFFKRKNLRSVKASSVSMNYTMLNKDIDLDNITSNNKYGVVNLNYSFRNPELINNFSYKADLEIGQNFSKISSDIRFRKLTNYNQQFGVRLFTGIFLKNQTTDDFFSYGVNRPNDYLFRYGYFGREETEGFFSQQIIINDGGFKSQMPTRYANQWITSLNTSVGLWRWFEIYNDVGFIKNKNQKVFFAHDKGVRLNFVNDIFEIYLPLHSNNGWEVSKPHYEKRIRFVLKAYFSTIYNYFKRGLL